MYEILEQMRWRGQKQLYRALFGVAALIGVLWLEGCGYPYCFAGLGDCSAYAQNTTGGGSSGGQLTVQAESGMPIQLSGSATFLVSGGTPPYAIAFASGSPLASQPNLISPASLPSSSTFTFTAPSAIPAGITEGTCPTLTSNTCAFVSVTINDNAQSTQNANIQIIVR